MNRLSKPKMILKCLFVSGLALSMSLSSVLADDYYDDDYVDSYSDSYAESYTDSAKVLKVKPIYETIEVNRPKKHCWKERVRYPHHRPHKRHYGGMITGGIIGGLAGNQIGGGSGKKVATVVGTIVGAAIGDDIAHSHHRPHHGHSRVERVCETVDHYVTRKELVGYRVKYRYKGRTYWTRTVDHPGDYIDVAVDVNPIE